MRKSTTATFLVIALAGFGISAAHAQAPAVCSDSYTPTYSIQGSGLTATITGPVTTQGTVVGDFEGLASLGGFYLQDPTGDADPATSDGIFVYTGAGNLVALGQLVRVTGYARERYDQTALNGLNSDSAAVPAADVVLCGSGSIAATDVYLPFAGTSAPERYEGMLVRFPQALVISEYFNFDRFGEIVLALPLPGEARAYTGTAVSEPGAPAVARTLDNSRRRIVLEDAVSTQNPAVLRHPNGNPFSLTNSFRGGDTVQNAIGVLGHDYDLYRIVPTGPADHVATNPRPFGAGQVGDLQVGAVNTLNYFLTLDYLTGNPLDNKCGPLQDVECRGADDADEFTRQRAKLVAALAGSGADILGLTELENTPDVDPLVDLVSGLNAVLGAGTYAAIDTGVIGHDAIRPGIIYKPAVVTPVGDFQVLVKTIDPRFDDTLHRPSLAQTFVVNGTGERFTVVMNHLKSKGSACTGDPDLGDGQGNCNLTRTAAAQALVDWLAVDPTGSGDPDFLVIGDLNAYAMEDPITAIKAGPDDSPGTGGDDYSDLINTYAGPFAYTYVFDGQAGYLDHALASHALAPQVTGVGTWHVNADEPDVFDYDTSFKPPAQEAFYEPNEFRTSDHDPVLVGLRLSSPWGFGGFSAPVDPPPTVNTVKAGASVPVKFSLNGDRGLDVFAPGYPRVVMSSSCSAGAADAIEQTAGGDGSSLSYDPATGLYTYVWKTQKAWAGSCRRIELKFRDGRTTAYADFYFR